MAAGDCLTVSPASQMEDNSDLWRERIIVTSGGKGGESSWQGEPTGARTIGSVFLNRVLGTQVSIILFLPFFHLP